MWLFKIFKIVHVSCLISLPHRMLPKNCQMLLFSATFEESVWNFAQRIVPDPNIIKLKREEETLDTIKQYYVLCNSKEEKFQALSNIYGAITIAQAMIFCHVSWSLILKKTATLAEFYFFLHKLTHSFAVCHHLLPSCSSLIQKWKESSAAWANLNRIVCFLFNQGRAKLKILLYLDSLYTHLACWLTDWSAPFPLFNSDKEDSRLAGRGAVQRRPPGSAA